MLQTPIVLSDSVPTPDTPEMPASLEDEIDVISPEFHMPSMLPPTPAPDQEADDSESHDSYLSSPSSSQPNPASKLNTPLQLPSEQGPSSPTDSPPIKRQKREPRRIDFANLPPEPGPSSRSDDPPPPPTSTQGENLDWPMRLPMYPPTLHPYNTYSRPLCPSIVYPYHHNSLWHRTQWNDAAWMFDGMNTTRMPPLPSPPPAPTEDKPDTSTDTQDGSPFIPPTYHRMENAVANLEASFHDMDTNDPRPAPRMPPSFICPPYCVDPLGRVPPNEKKDLFYILIDNLPEDSWTMEELLITDIHYQQRVLSMDHHMNRTGDPYLHVGFATIGDAKYAMDKMKRWYGPKLTKVMISATSFADRDLRF